MSPMAENVLHRHEVQLWGKTWRLTEKVGIDLNARVIFENPRREVSFRDKSVLELCSGSGRMSYLALQSGAKEATVVDFSEVALGIAKGLFEGSDRATFVKADILDVDLHERYDIVFSSGGVEHFRDEELPLAVRAHAKHSAEYVAVVVPSDVYFNGKRSIDPKNAESYGYWKSISPEKTRELFESQDIHVTSNRLFHITYSITLPRTPHLRRLEPVLYRVAEPLLGF
jgi:SAM-dependent methyltransferase